MQARMKRGRADERQQTNKGDRGLSRPSAVARIRSILCRASSPGQQDKKVRAFDPI